MHNVMSYEARVAKINCDADIQKQTQLAKSTVTRFRNLSIAPNLTLAEKLAYLEQVNHAEQVLRKLRFTSFDIEDMLAARQATQKAG